MTSEQIVDALNWVEDEWLMELETLRQTKKQQRRKWIPVAACVGLVTLLGGGLLLSSQLSQITSDYSTGNSNQLQEHSSGEEGQPSTPEGVYIPPMEWSYNSENIHEGLMVDMVSFFLYQGRIYMECGWVDVETHLLGEYVGTADGSIDEWSESSMYVDGTGTAWGDFYTVQGYDPSHLLCIPDDQGNVRLFWNNNDITVSTGEDILEDIYHLSQGLAVASLQSHADFDNFHTIEDMDSLNTWLDTLCNTPAQSTESKDLGQSTVVYHLFLEKVDGVTVHLLLYEGNCVSIAGLDAWWNMDWSSLLTFSE